MHATLLPEFRQALDLMKYSLNHWWKFQNYHVAFILGLCQLLITIAIEFANAYVVLMTSQTIFDILANFVVLLAIAEFDNIFMQLRPKDHINTRLTDDNYKQMLKWETTTSWEAAAKTKHFELPEERVLRESEKHERPKYIRIGMLDRPVANAMYYLLFRLLTIIYNTIVHYFVPFIATFILTVEAIQRHGKDD